jgi:hypothetical protein
VASPAAAAELNFVDRLRIALGIDPEEDEFSDDNSRFNLLTGGRQPEQITNFAGLDMQRFGVGAYAGLLLSPTPGRDGLAMRLIGAQSVDEYRTPTGSIRNQTLRAALTPGYRISRPGFELSAFAGVEIAARVRLPITRRTQIEPDVGMRMSADTWWQPIAPVMISANLSMTTIDAFFAARVASGIRVFDVWTGPEISASTDIWGQTLRVGGHVTSMRTANVELSFAAGYAFDSFGRQGIYTRLGITLRERDPMTIMP